MELRCDWVGVVSVLQAEACWSFGVVGLEWYLYCRLKPFGASVWLGWSGIRVAGCASACNTDTTPTEPHQNSNTHRIKNNTTNVVIQQNSRKLLMMDILMSETF